MLLILIFVADASVTAWRRGDRRKALMVGGSVEFFLLARHSCSPRRCIWAHLQAPIVVSSAVPRRLVVVMGYELSRDVLRASQLVQRASSERSRAARKRGAHEPGRRCRRFWHLDLGPRAERDLGERQVAGVVRLRAVGAAGPRRHPATAAPRRSRSAPAGSRDGDRGPNGGRYQTEYRLLLPDGAIRWISSRGRVEFDASGRPVRMRGASRDVTARKQAEQETQRLRQEIAHAGRVSMMGQLASGLAHEINQPLGAILRNAEAAELFLQHPSPDLDEIRAILADIRKDDQRAGQVIDRMRGLLKRQTLDTRRLDVGALVGDVAALVRVDAAARQVKLDVDVPGDLPPVRGDRVHLQQVLLNLILNGMDALNGASREDRRVSVTARLDGAQTVEIAVSDTGPGIPADSSPGSSTRSSPPSRTAWAWAWRSPARSSRRTADGSGRRTRASGGATFRFTLPIAEEAAADMTATEPTVHIVDDDASFLTATVAAAAGERVRGAGRLRRRRNFSRSGKTMRRAAWWPICRCPA